MSYDFEPAYSMAVVENARLTRELNEARAENRSLNGRMIARDKIDADALMIPSEAPVEVLYADLLALNMSLQEDCQRLFKALSEAQSRAQTAYADGFRDGVEKAAETFAAPAKKVRMHPTVAELWVEIEKVIRSLQPAHEETKG